MKQVLRDPRWLIHLAGYAVTYALFVAGIEYRAVRAHRAAAERQALHLSGPLWDMARPAVAQYIALAGEAGGFQRLAVTLEDGEPFAEWIRETRPHAADRVLRQFGLLRERNDDTAIRHHGEVIGRLHTVWTNRHLYLDAYGLVLWLLAMATHVFAATTRKAKQDRAAAEQKLADENRKLETVVTGAPLMVFAIGPDRRIILCRGRALEALGWSQDALLGRPVLELAENWPELEADVARSFAGETFAVRRTLREKTLEIRFSPLGGDERKGVIGVATDVTDLEAALEELQERDQRMHTELQLAKSIQQALMPAEPPALPGFAFGMLFQPSVELSGDVLHFADFRDDPYRTGVVLADIMGHGIAAALLSTMFRALIEEAFASATAPSARMTELNRLLGRRFPEGHFATVSYAELDARERRVTWVSASQEYLHLFRADGTEEVLDAGGPAPGLLRAGDGMPATYRQGTTRMRPGDTLLLYTDGLVEVWNAEGEELGRERFLGWIREALDDGPQAALDQTWARVTAYAGTERLPDDASAVLVRAV